MRRLTSDKAKDTGLFTVAEAAAYVRVSTRFMYTLFHSKQLIPTHRTGGGIPLYSKRQLDTLCRKRDRAGTRGRPYNATKVPDWMVTRDMCS